MNYHDTPLYEVPRLLTVDETAEYLRVDRSTIYRLVREGQIRTVRAGTRLRFRIADLADHLEREVP